MSLMLTGKADTVANTNTVIASVPATSSVVYAMLNIYITNTINSDAVVSLYISDTDNPTASDCIDFNTTILAGPNSLVHTHLVCLPGERIFVYSDKDGLSAQVRGYLMVNVPTQAFVVKKTLTPNTDDIIYTIPPDTTQATLTAKFVNMNTGDPTVDPAATLKYGFSNTPNLVNKDLLDKYVPLSVNGGGLERTCIPVSGSENFIANVDTGNITTRTYGIIQRPV